MGKVIVVTRNGYGDVWLFGSLLEVRLHPITSPCDDVVAASGRELLESYDRSEVRVLADRLPESGQQRATREALENWSQSDSRRARDEAYSAAEVVFGHLVRTARSPPENADELLAIIRSDRKATEGRLKRYRTTNHDTQESVMGKGKVSLAGSAGEEQKKAEAAEKAAKKAAATEAKSRASRVSDDTVIRMGKDKEGKPYSAENSPKRPGSETAKRFANFRDGITVGEVKKLGSTAGDIAYEVAHGYIVLEPPAGGAATAPEAAADQGEQAASEETGHEQSEAAE